MRKNRRHNNNNFLRIILLSSFLVILFLSFFFLSHKSYRHNNFDWAGINSELKDSIISIERKGSSYFSTGGYSGIKETNGKVVFSKATDKELKTLLNYPNGFVKAMSYQFLILNGKNDNFNLMKNAMNDTMYSLSLSSGCTSDDYLIGEYLMENVLFIGDNYPPPPKKYMDKINLYQPQIDSLLYILELRLQNKNRYILKAQQIEEKYY